MSTSQYIIIALIIILLIVAGRLYRLSLKNRWKGLNDFGVACVDTNEKVCSLTFDDGPHPVYTPLILDTLRKYNIKATFFVLGKQAKKYPELVERMAREEHDIGNHSTTHARLSYASAHKTIREIKFTQHIIQSITGQAPSLLRPPHGRFSSEQEDMVREYFGFPQHYVITWDICTYDWETPGRDCLIGIVKQELRPGSIILFHDVHQGTADNLEAVINELQSEGYSILPVSELLTKGTPLQIRE